MDAEDALVRISENGRGLLGRERGASPRTAQTGHAIGPEWLLHDGEASEHTSFTTEDPVVKPQILGHLPPRPFLPCQASYGDPVGPISWEEAVSGRGGAESPA